MQGTDHAVADIATLIDATLKDVQEGNEIKLPVNHPLITKWKDILFEVFSRLDHEFDIFDSYNLPQISENGLYYVAEINRHCLVGVLEWIEYGSLQPIVVRDITLDLSKGKLTVGSETNNILPKIKESIFLTMLLKRPGHIVEYPEIAERIGYYKKKPKDESVPAEMQRDINYLKRDLKKCLVKAKFSQKSVKSVLDRVRSVSKSGYMFSID